MMVFCPGIWRTVRGLRQRFSWLIVLLCLVTIRPDQALSYADNSHQRITQLAMPKIPGLKSYNLICPKPETLTRFRLWFDGLCRTQLEGDLLRRFLARYPKAGDLAAPMAFRHFLGHNIEPNLPGTSGIDRPLICKKSSATGLAGYGSMAPDQDRRNQNRIYRDPEGVAPRDEYNRVIPMDPALLNMGNTTGLSSQAHAHYALPPWELSSDKEVLQDHPERFAIAMGWPDEPVLTFAHEQGQMHYDLALLTLHFKDPSAEALAWLHVGASLHYVQDAANPIHNVQVGLYAFFKTAKIHSIIENILSAGGALGDRIGFVDRGLQILVNHHLIAEKVADLVLFAGASLTAGTTRGYYPSPLDLKTLSKPLSENFDQLKTAMKAKLPISELIQTLARLGALEGSEIYEHTFSMTSGGIHRGSAEVPDPIEELDNVISGSPASNAKDMLALDRLFRTTLRRAIFCSQLVLEAFYAERTEALSQTENVERLLQRTNQQRARLLAFVQNRLDSLDAEDTRRARYRKNPPEPRNMGIAWMYLFLDLFVIALIVGLIARVRRKSKREPSTSRAHVLLARMRRNKTASTKERSWYEADKE